MNLLTDEDWTSISSHEITGTNYTTGGFAIGTKTVNSDGVDTTVFDSSDLVISNITTDDDFRYVILYSSTSGKLIGVYDLGQDYGLVGKDLVLVPDQTNGYLYFVNEPI